MELYALPDLGVYPETCHLCVCVYSQEQCCVNIISMLVRQKKDRVGNVISNCKQMKPEAFPNILQAREITQLGDQQEAWAVNHLFNLALVSQL